MLDYALLLTIDFEAELRSCCIKFGNDICLAYKVHEFICT